MLRFAFVNLLQILEDALYVFDEEQTVAERQAFNTKLGSYVSQRQFVPRRIHKERPLEFARDFRMQHVVRLR